MNAFVILAATSILSGVPSEAPPTLADLEGRLAALEKRQYEAEKKLDTFEKKFDAQDKKLDAILSAVTTAPRAPTVVIEPPKATVAFGPAVVSARAPVGHTHTCANGHTWDHQVSAGHNCPVCGLYQNVQDPVPRAVNVGVGTRGLAPAYGDAQFAPYNLGAGSFGAAAGEGGCANGSCSAGRGLFRGGSGPVRGIFGRIFGRR